MTPQARAHLQALVVDLTATYDRHYRGHKDWCRKATRIGVRCTCGGDALAALILDMTALVVEEAKPCLNR